MKTEFEKQLIGQCAPTLAGIKAGSLFRYTEEKNEDISETIGCWNEKLIGKGVRICSIQENYNGGLIYVFRPSMLIKLLSDKNNRLFLQKRGYTGCYNLDAYIKRLRCRFSNELGFPHEIGIFLDYPLHDVQGFIENQGRNFNLCGLWKVYGERHHAQRLFAKYDKCKNIYQTMFENGSPILRLTVAA